ncbi:S8 family serine peptidase [Ferruginibacter sp. SUN106]|uniref:S8 family serine peptidase n=1 Tax=Ferruginibacter sp. SUN106 TaxID=2978348 RepID=UPI003D366F40
MKKRILVCVFFSFIITHILAQSGYYYYKGQPKSVTYSTRILFVHFAANLTNTQKQDVISNASVDLLNGNLTNIPNYVKLQSRIVSGWHWVYPCLIESKTSNNNNKKDSIKPDPNYMPVPCEGCPDCTPRYEYYEYNNFDNALYQLSNNSNVRSVSKGFSYLGGIVASTGTEENFYIKIKPAFTINDFTGLLTNYSFVTQDVSTDFGSRVYKISVTRDKSTDLMGWANVFYNTGMCEYSTPNFLEIGNITCSNDPRWPEQWGLLNIGQYNGIPGADIRAVNAWQFTKGNNVKVAVIDDGALPSHPDLAANYLPGFNFDPNSTSIIGWHGAKSAGAIAAIADNGIDITGIAPESKIIPVKVFNSNDDAVSIGLADQLTKGINWAVDNGAEILYCGWGVNFESEMIDRALTDAAISGRNGKGCLLVFPTGNENSAIRFPTATHPDIIAVGAITPCNSRKIPISGCDAYPYDPAFPEFGKWGSNYGTNLGLMAPGVRMPAINVDPSYSATDFNGTSAAAPLVAGTGALVLEINPNLTQSQVRKIIELSSNKVGNYCYNWTPAHPNGAWNIEMGYGRLNAYNAAQLARPGVTISNTTYNVTSQASNAVTGNIAMTFNNLACPTTLPFGLFFLKRHEVTATINYANTPNPVIICSSNGFTQANPNDGRHWAEAINVTNTSATLRTYVYYGYNSIGQELGWIPTSPSSITFSYVVVGSPVNIDYQSTQSKGSITKADSIKKIPFKLDFADDIIVNDIPFEFSKNRITPNPVINLLTLKINSEIEGAQNIEIVNSLGVKVKSILNKSVSKGVNTLSIDVSGLSRGIYLLKCGTSTYKFIKS